MHIVNIFRRIELQLLNHTHLMHVTFCTRLPLIWKVERP